MKFKDFRVIRAKRTVVGRMICRLIGDEKGAVAMEYVVIALLIIAAAVGAAVYFGRAITGGFQAAGDIITDTNTDVETRTKNANDKLKAIKAQGATTTNTVQSNMTGSGYTETVPSSPDSAPAPADK